TYLSDRIRAFGIDPAMVMGKRRIDLAADPDDPRWREHIACLERREPFTGFVYRYGKEHYSYASGKPLFDAAGQFVGYRGTGRDVTEVIHAEQRLREAKTHAKAAKPPQPPVPPGPQPRPRHPLAPPLPPSP